MIVWNKVTWYSKLAAVIFFIGILPIWTFYMGMQYERTINEIKNYSTYSFLISSTTTPVSTGTTSTPVINKSGIKGMVTIGPTCPVEKFPPDPNCADKPYQANLVAIHRTTAVQTKFSSSKDGKFFVDLSPGDYSIRNDSNTALPRMENYEITVREGSYTNLDIKFDSGIR